MTTNELTITISGPVGCGKSTLATILSMLLSDFEFETEMIDNNGTDTVENVTVPTEDELEKRFMSLMERGIKVKVCTLLT